MRNKNMIKNDSTVSMSSDPFIQQVNKKPIIFACIPAYNEELSIGKIILQVQKSVDMVIVCDDGSVDYTSGIAQALGATVITHEKNEGKGSALRDMFEFALSYNPDIVLVLDADGQHDPFFIKQIIEPLINKEADMVIGSRFVKGGKTDAPIYRRIGLFLLNRNLGGNVKDVQSGFRAFTRQALEVISKTKADDFGVELEQVSIASKSGLRVKEVPIEIRYKGIVKTSKRNPIVQGGQIIRTYIRLALDDPPLTIIGIFSTLLVAVGVLSGTLLLLNYANHYFNEFYAIVFLTCISLGVLIGLTSIIIRKLSFLLKLR
jgi:glycosyltransferase involved in cell wall biosynthesis